MPCSICGRTKTELMSRSYFDPRHTLHVFRDLDGAVVSRVKIDASAVLDATLPDIDWRGSRDRETMPDSVDQMIGGKR